MPLAGAEGDTIMPEDIDDLFAQAAMTRAEAAAEGPAAGEGVVPGLLEDDVSMEELSDSGRAIVVATDMLAQFGGALEALRRLPAIPLATPEQRQLAVRLYRRLEPIESAVGLWRRMVEANFRDFLVGQGADRATLPDGRFVSYSPPPAAWEADGSAMRAALERLVTDGVLTRDQVDEIVRVEVTYRVDNTRANAAARHMGTRVAEAIDGNRRRVAGRGQGTVTIPKGDL